MILFTEKISRLIFMKKILLALLAVLPLAVSAQKISGSGYYRVQNLKSSRYFMLVDNRAWITTNNTDLNLGAIKLVKGFEEKICWNPATICYLDKQSEYKYNIIGMGLNMYNLVGSYMDFDYQTTGTYRNSYIISGTGKKGSISMSKTLYDSERRDTTAALYTKGTDGYQYWYVRPVSGDYYFGVKPDFEAEMNGSKHYYTTMYASFPFRLGTNMKAYYIQRIVGSYAIVKPLEYSVPGAVPVIVECAGATPKDNKVDLQASTASVNTNLLQGVWFCNDTNDDHRNVTNFDGSTMRLLGQAADGRLAFVKPANQKYVPANKAYLQVPAGTPATLYVITEEELTGVQQIQADTTPVRKGVYTLSGQRVGESTEGLSAGVYIVDGKKVVVK